MAATAWLIVLGTYLEDGFFSRPGLLLITAAIVVSAGTLAAQRSSAVPAVPKRIWTAGLMAALLVEIRLLVLSADASPRASAAIAVVGALALAQAMDLGRWRLRLFALAAIGFVMVAAAISITRDPQTDVFTFQQLGARALIHGASPYAIRMPNLYPPTTPFYGPGVVDGATNTLNIGLPYPPASLMLVLPGYLLAGDVRVADAVAIALAAALIVAARPSRWSGVAAAAFLLTPNVFFLVYSSWTEALMALTFSAVMYCALRRPTALPYALGAFFATKQTSVLAAPLVWLLVDGPDRSRRYAILMAQAAGVAAVLTVPFFLWTPAAFWRSGAPSGRRPASRWL